MRETCAASPTRVELVADEEPGLLVVEVVVRFAPIVDSVQMIAVLTLVIFHADCLHGLEPGQLVQWIVKVRVPFHGLAFIASCYRWAAPRIEAPSQLAIESI